MQLVSVGRLGSRRPPPCYKWDFAGARALPQGATYSGASGKTCFDATGQLVWAAENIIPNSENLSGYTATNMATPVTDGTFAQDGVTLAYKLQASAGNASHMTGRATSIGDSSKTQSYQCGVDVKQGTSRYVMVGLVDDAPWHTVIFDFQTGTIVNSINVDSSSATQLSNGWWRIVVSCTYTTNGGSTKGSVGVGPVLSAAAINFTYNAAGTETVYASRVSCCRTPNASSAYVKTNGGAYYGPRFDYHPVTLASLGYKTEAACTNGIRNNMMENAASGTPGTLPTNWTVGGLGGLSSSVVAVSTVNGIRCIDIRYFGTMSSSGGYLAVFESSSAIASSQNQMWTASCFLALVAGSLANVTSLGFDLVSYPGGNDNGGPDIKGSLTSTLARFSFSLAIPNVGNANIQPRLQFNATNGAAVDFTLRIGMPQMESGGNGMTSVIPTANAAATRAVDNLSMPVSLLPGYQPATGGVMVAAYAIHSAMPSTSLNLYQAVFLLNDGTFNNHVTCRAGVSGDPRVAAFMVSAAGSAGGTQYNGASPAPYVRDKVAVGWSSQRVGLARNGGAVVGTSGALNLPVNPTTLQFAQYSGDRLNGTLESFAYYPGDHDDGFISAVSA